jgi:membrane-associated phospholipid phosphatase
MAAALLAALIIGWTRVALAVHWPSDVLAGWGLGLLWLGLSLAIRNVVAPAPEPSTAEPPAVPPR